MKTLAIAALTAALTTSATAALAGPVGMGLGFTEETLRKHMASRTVTVAVLHACGGKAAETLRTRQDVTSADHKDGKLEVVFRQKASAEHHETVQATVSEACRIA